MRVALQPFSEFRVLAPALQEIEERLLEETDYCNELANLAFFRTNMDMAGIRVPKPNRELSTETVLSAEQLDGLPLDEWLRTGPDQSARDRVAQNPTGFIPGRDISIALHPRRSQSGQLHHSG